MKNMKNYCKYKDRVPAALLATQLGHLGIKARLSQQDVGPYSSTQPEDRPSTDYRWTLEMSDKDGVQFEALRAEFGTAKLAGQSMGQWLEARALVAHATGSEAR